VFIDGNLVSQNAWDLLWDADAKVYLGNWPLGGRRFTGIVDEVIVTRNVFKSANFVPAYRIGKTHWGSGILMMDLGLQQQM
jgi:hypothetical protein